MQLTVTVPPVVIVGASFGPVGSKSVHYNSTSALVVPLAVPPRGGASRDQRLPPDTSQPGRRLWLDPPERPTSGSPASTWADLVSLGCFCVTKSVTARSRWSRKWCPAGSSANLVSGWVPSKNSLSITSRSKAGPSGWRWRRRLAGPWTTFIRPAARSTRQLS